MDLLAVFPTAVPIVKRLIKDTKRKIEDVKEFYGPHYDDACVKIYAMELEEWQEEIQLLLVKWWCFDQHLDPIFKELERLERIFRLYTYREAIHNSPDEVNEATIEGAKSRRIEEFLSERPNHAGFINCPFHNEKTASCKINGGRFHCFGCSADGDVIDWVMKMQGKDFLNAVRFLSKI